MIQGDFQTFQYFETIGFSHSEFCLEVQTLHSAAGKSPFVALNQLRINSLWLRSIRATFFIGFKSVCNSPGHPVDEK
jgi:hypothetical protein